MTDNSNKSMRESRSSILKMKEDTTMEFVMLYEKEEALWNTRNVNYKNKEERLRAQNRVAEALKIPNFKGKHVMIKFKNLRNSYCQELRKIAEAEEEGEVYKPKVFWFSRLNSFLRPHLSRSFCQGQFQIDSSNSPEVKVKEEDDWPISVADSETDNVQDYFSEDGQSLASTSGNQVEPVNKKPRIETVTVTPNANDPLKSEPCSKDYYDDFGRYIASLLRTLPAKKALAMQPKIVSLIADLAYSDTD